MNRLRIILLSLAWLLLMVFFTYTILIVNALDINVNFLDSYCKNQHSAISMLVNIGLLVMTMFDCISSKVQSSYKMFIWVMTGVAVSICIYGWSEAYLMGSYQHYTFPINWKYLPYCLHCLFFVVLFCLKYYSLSGVTDEGDLIIKEEF